MNTPFDPETFFSSMMQVSLTSWELFFWNR